MDTLSVPENRAGLLMRVDYHLHTCFSFDCDTSLEDVAASAVTAGLDRICVTDHDTLEGAQRLADTHPASLEVVVGCELTATDGSQVIGLGLSEVAASTTVLSLMEGIKAQGGQVLIPHPFRHRGGVFRKGMKRPAGFVDEVLELTDLVECFNGRDSYQVNKANHRFAVERGLSAVAASDAHTAEAIGSVFVEYPGDESASDDAPRSIYFPDQQPSPDLRRVKQVFQRLPGPVQEVARNLRRGAGLAPRVTTASDARWQYQLPAPDRRRGEAR